MNYSGLLHKSFIMKVPTRYIHVTPVLILTIINTINCSKITLEESHQSTGNASHMLDMLLSHMDARVRPEAMGPPIVVRCGFYVISFGSVSEVNMEYTMDIYMRQSWKDTRLTYNTSAKYLSLNSKSINKVWTPDLFFPNEKSASFHEVTVPNRLMKVYPNGTIMYSVRITVTLSCAMILTHFPMDHQECYVKIESYGYEISDMELEWFDEGAVEVNDELELPQFDLVDYDTASCMKMYKTGNFPCLKAKFKLRRQFGFYLLQTYIPSILIVILSWVSFWINMDAVPARISLGVTTILTMSTQLSGSKASIPRVSYPKAIDVWMAMCMIFVFGSLIEYAFVNVLARKNSNAKYKKTENEEDADIKHTKEVDSDVDSPARLRDIQEFKSCMNSRRAAILIDKTSRFLFPGTFILFNVIYWAVYTQPH